MSDVAKDERPPATLPWPNWVAYVLALLALLATAALPFALAAGDMSLNEAVGEYYLQSFFLFGILGALVLWRRPGHVIGWVLVAIGAFDMMARSSDLYELFGLAGVSGFPPFASVDRFISWAWVPSVAGIAIAFPQLFPDGRVVSRRWRLLFGFGVAATAFLSFLFLVDPLAEGPAFALAFPLFGLAALSSLVPLVIRYRRSRGEERQQLKWAFYGFAVSGPLLVASTSGVVLGAMGAIWAIPPMVILPACLTAAVLRYRLFDIDIVISKTLLVAGLAGFIAAAYVSIVVGVGSLVGRGDEPNLVLSVAATALVAVAFQPVRRRLRRVANRLVFGRRASPYDVLSGFATRVGAAEASTETLVGLAELMADGTGAQPARVWLRVGSQLRPAATWPVEQQTGDQSVIVQADSAPTLPDADLAVPVLEQDELLGVLTIAKPRGERVAELDVDLVERLAAASGVLLRNLRLDAELAQRLEEIEASRQRLVGAQDEARRRIEAELGGGTRAQLTMLREQMSHLAGDLDADSAPKTAMLLSQLVTSTDTALETLAGLAAGVYPPRLASDGLAVALSEQAGRASLPVTVEAAGVGRYPADVEAAVYFAVLEALQNVAKYAAAGTARIRLALEAGRLTFEVTDDGVGFDSSSVSLGTGLQGIVDRLDTVGGSVIVVSEPGTGTTLAGSIPVVPSSAPGDTSSVLTGATR